MTLSDKRLELKALRSNKSIFTHCRIGVEGKAANLGGECNALKQSYWKLNRPTYQIISLDMLFLICNLAFNVDLIFELSVIKDVALHKKNFLKCKWLCISTAYRPFFDKANSTPSLWKGIRRCRSLWGRPDSCCDHLVSQQAVCGPLSSISISRSSSVSLPLAQSASSDFRLEKKKKKPLLNGDVHLKVPLCKLGLVWFCGYSLLLDFLSNWFRT